MACNKQEDVAKSSLAEANTGPHLGWENVVASRSIARPATGNIQFRMHITRKMQYMKLYV
jgi:hypothetical protein